MKPGDRNVLVVHDPRVTAGAFSEQLEGVDDQVVVAQRYPEIGGQDRTSNRDDLLAIGLYLDDCGPENGPLMVIPGSHTWPILDHHVDGVFCGAIAPSTANIDFSKAVALTGKAGNMTIHHVRMVHGSALNTSDRPRRLLLFQYTAVDAFPLLGIPDWEKFNANIVTGNPTAEPRLTPVPVRIPLPAAIFEGSIYENQRTLGSRYFAVYEEARAVEPT